MRNLYSGVLALAIFALPTLTVWAGGNAQSKMLPEEGDRGQPATLASKPLAEHFAEADKRRPAAMASGGFDDAVAEGGFDDADACERLMAAMGGADDLLEPLPLPFTKAALRRNLSAVRDTEVAAPDAEAVAAEMTRMGLSGAENSKGKHFCFQSTFQDVELQHPLSWTFDIHYCLPENCQSLPLMTKRRDGTARRVKGRDGKPRYRLAYDFNKIGGTGDISPGAVSIRKTLCAAIDSFPKAVHFSDLTWTATYGKSHQTWVLSADKGHEDRVVVGEGSSAASYKLDAGDIAHVKSVNMRWGMSKEGLPIIRAAAALTKGGGSVRLNIKKA